jgi:hypothetical protein
MRTATLLPCLLAAAALASCKTELRCPTGETACGERCVSLLTDDENCGRCGLAATPLQVCRAAQLTCAPGVGTCDGACTDLARDPQHCGDCATACGDAQRCLTDGDGTRCVDACPTGFEACGGACVQLDTDRLSCGACGNACRAGQACRAGSCAPELVVACFASHDVRPVTGDLQPAGPARPALGDPTTLLVQGNNLFSGNGNPAGVTVFPLDDRQPTRAIPLAGNDIQGLESYGGMLLVANSGVNTVVVIDPSGGVVDELSLGAQKVYPHGMAVIGSSAYLALYGDGPDGFDGYPAATGQAILKIDLSDLPGCVAGTEPHCAAIARTIDLASVAGAADEGAYPFPSELAVRGTKVYAILANLEKGDCGGGWMAYCQPAGDGRLAVIDTADADAVSIVDLGPSCKNPGALQIAGDTAWIACGSYSFSDLAPGAVLPVDLSGPTPQPGTAIALTSIVPGGLAICGGMGYVTDQASGGVIRFDTTTRVAESPVTVCPTVNWAWAADVACPRP